MAWKAAQRKKFRETMKLKKIGATRLTSAEEEIVRLGRATDIPLDAIPARKAYVRRNSDVKELFVREMIALLREAIK